MKIALFTDSFLPGKGGTENAIANLVLALQKKGHIVRIYCPDYHQPEQESKDFSVFRVKSIALTKNEMMALPSLCKKKMLQDLEMLDPDIFYFCSASGMAKAAVYFAKKFKRPLAATIHTKFHMAFYNSSKSKLITAALIKSLANKLNKADGVTTVSNDMARVLKEYGCKKDVQVIKNGMNKNLNYEDKEKSFEHFNFLFCGHVIKVKNIQFTIKCLGNLKAKYNFDNFTFNIAGTGNYQNKLEKLAKKCKIDKNVKFFGYISDKNELGNIYSKSHLLLFPSPFDNDGLVVLEAASYSTPTLALNGYGCGERITDNQTGFLSDYDEKAFTERLWQIINDKVAYQKVRKGLANLKAKSWEQISDEYLEFFDNLIKNNKNK